MLLLAIPLTVAVTLVVVLILANFVSGEKKVEHNIDRLYSSDDPQFIRSMSLLLGPPVTSGNRYAVLLNGDEIFPSMLDGIQSAKESITFETFIYWSGEIGAQRRSVALSARLDRGGAATKRQSQARGRCRPAELLVVGYGKEKSRHNRCRLFHATERHATQRLLNFGRARTHAPVRNAY